MYSGFPLSLISLLRCHHDNGELVSAHAPPQPAAYVTDGLLECRLCQTRYPIRDGIVRMLDVGTLDEESDNERQRRDQAAQSFDTSWERTDWNMMEIEPTIAASEPLANALVLELGAGTGRYTAHMADRGATMLAVDFAEISLAALAARVQPSWKIGLVQADCTRLRVRQGAFDLVASTLMSNLPTIEHRKGLFEVAARACQPLGKFVFSTHFYSLRNVLRREPRSGYYREDSIYRYLFRPPEIRRETSAYFSQVTIHPIQIGIPFLRRLGVPVVKLSRWLERVPVVNELGDLLLLVARAPRPVPNDFANDLRVSHV